MRQLFATTLALAITLGLAPSAFAHWSVNAEESVLSFVTVKADHVAEVHTFDRITGYIEDDGSIDLKVHLASVNTMIPIRNERMQAMLFETHLFPTAKISAQVDIGKYEDMDAGATESLSLDFQMSLRGQQQNYSADITVTRLDEGIRVSTVKPVIVSADSFDLASGVEALREVAGLPSISKAVPVSFQLMLSTEH